MGAWVLVAVAASAALFCAQPASADQPTLAVVETDKELSPLAALLTAQLSQEGVKLVERKQLDAVLQEQALSAAGLTDRATLVKVGALVRADAFVLLSIEKAEGGALLRVRIAETAHGVRLLDAFESWDARKADDAVGALAGRLKGVVEKLKLPAGQVVAVGIIDVRRTLLGDEYQWLCRALRSALSARLSVEPRLVVLEREDLNLLMQEKALTSGEQAGFWRSAVLIDGLLSPAGAWQELKLTIQGAGGQEEGAASVQVTDQDAGKAAEAAADQLIPKLTAAAAGAAWEPAQEAAEFFRQGDLLNKNARRAEAVAALSTACALQPQNAEYAYQLFFAALFASNWTGTPEMPAVELAELAGRAVRLAAQPGTPSSATRWMSAPMLAGYLTSPLSSQDPRARELNRPTRKLWAQMHPDGWLARPGPQGANLPDASVLGAQSWSLAVAVASADTAAEAMANVEQVVRENVLPSSEGGKYSTLALRVDAVRSAFGMSDRVAAGHLLDEEKPFHRQLTAYLSMLAKHPDPVVRIAANGLLRKPVAAPSDAQAQELRHVDRAACAEGIASAYLELLKAGPMDSQVRHDLIGMVAIAIGSGGMPKEKTVTWWEQLLAPDIESRDVNDILAWQFSPGMIDIFSRSAGGGQDVELAGRLYRLMVRVEDVLEPHQDQPEVKSYLSLMEMGLTLMLNGYRVRLAGLQSKRDALQRDGKAEEAAAAQSTIDRYLAALEPLREGAGRPPVRVRMLLAEKEWALPWQWSADGWPFARLECQDGLIWVAITDNSSQSKRSTLGLAGLDPRGGAPVAVWQAKPPARYSASWLVGLVPGKAHTYTALRHEGLLELPGTDQPGKGVITEPRVLGEKDGLPASPITGLAGTPEKMWVGFGGGGKGGESGLGLYNALTGEWKTLFSSMDKHPLASGPEQPYTPTEIHPIAADGTVLYCAGARLWVFDPRSGEAQQLVYERDCFLSAGPPDAPCFLSHSALLRTDTQRKRLQVVLASTFEHRAMQCGIASWTLEDNTFAPPDEGERLLSWVLGGIDLSTAAVHGDQLWARCGKTQIAILQRGQKVEEAVKINNDILDGGPVLQFFETPFGLLAVGQGSVGIVEIEEGK